MVLGKDIFVYIPWLSHISLPESAEISILLQLQYQ